MHCVTNTLLQQIHITGLRFEMETLNGNLSTRTHTHSHTLQVLINTQSFFTSTYRHTQVHSELRLHSSSSTHLLPNSRNPEKVLLLCRQPTVTLSPSGKGLDRRSELDEEADVEATEVVTSSLSCKPAPSSCSIRSLVRQSNNCNQSQSHAFRESSWREKLEEKGHTILLSASQKEREDNTNSAQCSRSLQTSTCDPLPIRLQDT